MATLEDIEREYDEAIRKAANNPQAAADLRVERVEAVAAKKLEMVAERERAVWKREALLDYPLVAAVPELVTGTTEQEVQASAKALSERLDKSFSEHARQKRMNELLQAQLAAQETTNNEVNPDAGPA